MTDTTEKRRKPEPAAATPEADEKERVAKVMARAGLCSRRDAEAWIKAGRVAINGKLITSPALNIGSDDVISVDGTPVQARERTRLFLYHKPRGLVTTAKDPEGRPTVFDNVPENLPRVVSVGRLDINTEGLLLLTNDGGLARVLELPSTGWLRRYRVRANGFVPQETLDGLRDGITIDGVDYAGIEATLDRRQGANVWLTMGLREGKNREIKRVLEVLGLSVNRLIRLSFGPFQLGELAEGDIEEVRTRVLRDQLGEALAQEAGVDWDGASATAAVVTRERAESQAREPRERPDTRGRGETGSRGRPDGRSTDRQETAPRSRRNAEGEAPRAGARGRPRGDGGETERPRQDRPAPRPRPHVSALRSEPGGRDTGPRKRIARASTEDAKGRTVKVERITTKEGQRHTGEAGTSRNARNFARARREAAEGEAPRREPRGDVKREPKGESKGEPKRSRGGFGSDRPQTGRALKEAKGRSSRPKTAGDSARPARSRPEGGSARPDRPPRGNGPGNGPSKGPGGGRGPKSGGSGGSRSGGDRPRSRPKT